MPQQEFDPYARRDTLRTGEGVDLVHQSAGLVLQSCVGAKATATIGPDRTSGPGPERTAATGRRSPS